MIIQCQGCAAKYFLPEDRVPHHPLKVKCPKCRAVFTLVARQEPVAVAAAAKASPSSAHAAVPALEPVAEASPRGTKPEPAGTPARKKSGGRGTEDRAKRLARVLVSDILFYNRDKRDQALEDGTLMTALSDDIKKSWELYKEKVGANVAGSTNHFKEALNEILADGQEVF